MSNSIREALGKQDIPGTPLSGWRQAAAARRGSPAFHPGEGIAEEHVQQLATLLQANALPPALAQFIVTTQAHVQERLGRPVSHATVISWLPQDLLVDLGGDHPAVQAAAKPTLPLPKAAANSPPQDASPERPSTPPAAPSGSALSSAQTARRQVQAQRLAYWTVAWSNAQRDRRTKKDATVQDESVQRLQKRYVRMIARAAAYASQVAPASVDMGGMALTQSMRRNAQGGHRRGSLETPSAVSSLQETGLRNRAAPPPQPPAFYDAT